MVSEKRSRKAKPKKRSAGRTPNSGSIWDTPHMKRILSEPVGTPIEFTEEEVDAALKEMLEDSRPVDREEWKRAHEEQQRIRRTWGSVARELDG